MIMDCMKTADPSMIGLFRPFGLKMEEQGIPPIVINIFKCNFARLLYGAQGKLPENELLPLTDREVPDYESFASYAEVGRLAMAAGASIEEINHALMGLTSTIGFPTVAAALSWVRKSLEEH